MALISNCIPTDVIDESCVCRIETKMLSLPYNIMCALLAGLLHRYIFFPKAFLGANKTVIFNCCTQRRVLQEEFRAARLSTIAELQRHGLQIGIIH